MIDQSVDFCSGIGLSSVKQEGRGVVRKGFVRGAKFAYDQWIIRARDRDGGRILNAFRRSWRRRRGTTFT